MVEAKKIGKNTVRVDVEIPPAEVQVKAAAVYAELARTVKVPGFRKGKTPRRILKRSYADRVVQTIVDELVPVAFERAAAELGLDAVSSPRYNVTAASEGGPISFAAEVAVFPEITLPDYAGFVVKRERPKVTDDDVAKALESLRQANARLEPVEGRGGLDGDLVILKFLDEEPPEGFSQPTVGVWASVRDEEDSFARQVMGKAPGDTFALTIDYPADYPSKRHAGKKVNAPVEVTEVKKRVLPELGDEFAKDLGEDGLGQLRAKLKVRLEARADEISYANAYGRFVEDIAAHADVPLDDAFVEQFLPEDDEGEGGKSRDERMGEARRELGRYFIVRELARRENVEITAEEVRDAITAAASRPGAAPERPAAVYDRLLNEKLAAKLIPREGLAEGGKADER
ncbi:MAG TPA: trigger factor [bacterium]|nr:trigger factor [bacterium]